MVVTCWSIFRLRITSCLVDEVVGFVFGLDVFRGVIVFDLDGETSVVLFVVTMQLARIPSCRS